MWMVGTILFAVVIGGLATLALRWRDRRAEKREARSRERIAAIVLYEEIKAAIDAINMALKDDSSKWLLSMSESATLTEVWREQAEALQGLGPEHWYVLSEAVSAVTPSYRLLSTNRQLEELRRSLAELRELLVKSAGIVLGVRDRQTQNLSGQIRRRIRSLLV